MKTILSVISLVIFIFPSVSISSGIQFFNTDMLGQPTSVQNNLLENPNNNESGLIYPKTVQIDIDDGLYSASSIYYEADKISFDELVENIDRKYPNSTIEKLSSKSDVKWRVEDKKFVISLSYEKEQGMFRVIYIRFMPTEKIMKHLKDTLETTDKNCNTN